jgi:hypothetical protein
MLLPKKLLRPSPEQARRPAVPAKLRRAAAERGLVVSPGMDATKLAAKGGKG